MTGSTTRSLTSLHRWLSAGKPRGIPRADLLAPALLRGELTEGELQTVVAALGLRAGHSVGDPIPDEDIRRIVRTWVFEGADEAEVYRVREALRRTGGRMMSHS
jgi:hypothetical protein